MAKQRGSSTPGLTSAPSATLEELRQSRKKGIQDHLQAPGTRLKYNAELARMRKWTGAYLKPDGTPTGPGNTAGPEFASAFIGPPTPVALEALAMYITYKCLHQDRGKSTAEGARAAAKKYWSELAGDKYRGKWHYDEYNKEWIGNPAESSEITELVKSVKNKCAAEGKGRSHAVAMKYDHMEKLMAWSRSVVPDEMAYHPPADREGRILVTKHLEFRTFLASGWTLWTRNFETSGLQYQHYTPGGTPSPPLCSPYFTMEVRDRKGWQRRLERDKSQSDSVEPDLRDNIYHIYPQPKLPAADMYYFMLLWLPYLATYVYGRPLEPADYLFPAIGASGVVQPLLCISADMVQAHLDEFTKKSGVAALVRGHFSTHCLRRGGAQHRFILAEPEERWDLIRAYWWGGWAPGERRDTLIRYLLDEKHLSETSHAHALRPVADAKVRSSEDESHSRMLETLFRESLLTLRREMSITIEKTLTTRLASQSLQELRAPEPHTPHSVTPEPLDWSSHLSSATHEVVPFSFRSPVHSISTHTAHYGSRPLASSARAATVFTYPIVPAMISVPQPVYPIPPSILPAPHHSSVAAVPAATLPPVLASVPPLPPNLNVLNVPLERQGKRDKANGWRDVVMLWEEGLPERNIIPLKDWHPGWFDLPEIRVSFSAKYQQRKMIALEYIEHFARDDARFLAAYGDATKCVTHLRKAITKARIDRGECAPRRSKNGSPAERATMTDDGRGDGDTQ